MLIVIKNVSCNYTYWHFIVLFVKFNSSEVYSILTSEVTSEGDDEHETETTGCLSKLKHSKSYFRKLKKES